MRDATTGKTSKRRKTDTDWEALSHLSDADIRASIESDPDAHATDEDFWKGAKVVLPKPPFTRRQRRRILSAWQPTRRTGWVFSRARWEQPAWPGDLDEQRWRLKQRRT
jgi:hypothetical protein